MPRASADTFDKVASGIYLEGLAIDYARDVIWYSDVIGGGVHSVKPDGTKVTAFNPERMWTGGVMMNADGSVLSTGEGGIMWNNPDTGKSGWLLDAIDGKPVNGINEMAPDGQGGIFFGTNDIEMVIKGEQTRPTEIYRLTADQQLIRLADGIGFTNGMMFDPARARFYCNDTFHGTWAFDVDDTLSLSNKRCPIEKADADGMALDAEGNLWVTGFRSNFFTRIAPDGGRLPDFPTPAGSITQLRFGGHDMRDIYFNSVPSDGGDTLKEGGELTAQNSFLFKGRSETPGMRLEPTRFTPRLTTRADQGRDTMNEMSNAGLAIETPVRIPIEAYVSEDYARAENEKLWPKVWQIACREEEIPKVGDYVTYDILDESIIVVRSGENKISAHYNVCPHRGRRITKGCGHAQRLHCRFHGWGWDLEGNNTYVLDPEDWGDSISDEKLHLKPVRVDTWGGWVWINMNPDCEPLLDFLKPASPMLDSFNFDKMRYRWRKWLHFPCNWKTALESFIESFHVDGTHPQLIQWGSNRWWCRTEGLHAWHGIGPGRGTATRSGAGAITVGVDDGMDPRVTMAELFNELWETVGTTTQTLVDAANRLVDELPADTSPEQLTAHVMQTAAMADARRGVPWPDMTPEHFAECGMDWHIFPNSAILPGITYALCYRARPDGYNPDSCIFEVYIIERFPEGEEPRTEWMEEPEPTEDKWQLILSQDFQNIGEIQKGMKSRGYEGAIPSPCQEVPIIHFHRTLAKYMGTGVPEPLDAA